MNGKSLKRKRGRPPLDEHDESVHIGVSVPSKIFDDLCDLARRRRMTLPALLRRLIYDCSALLAEKTPNK